MNRIGCCLGNLTQTLECRFGASRAVRSRLAKKISNSFRSNRFLSSCQSRYLVKKRNLWEMNLLQTHRVKVLAL
jgi:hypothetical protein